MIKGYEEGAIDYLSKPLDPEIAKAFPTGDAVNRAALRLLALTEQTARITARAYPTARKRVAA